MDRKELHLRLVEKHDTAMDFFKQKRSLVSSYLFVIGALGLTMYFEVL